MPQVIKLRVNRLVGHVAQQRNQAFPFRTAQAISFRRVEAEVKRAIIVSPQLEQHPRIQIQRPEPRLRGQECVSRPFTAACKREGAIQHQGLQLQFRLKRKVFQFRLSRAVPILQRRFQIPFLEINRSQKVVGVVILGIHRQSPAQLAFCQ